MRACEDIPGVLRLLDSHVDQAHEQPASDWFVAELATAFDAKLRGADLDEILHAATHPEPLERPTMHQLHLELVAMSRVPVAHSTDPIGVPSTLARALTERSGERERQEQSQARLEDQTVERRIIQWLHATFGAAVQELLNKIQAIDGIQVHRRTNRAAGALSPVDEDWTQAKGGVPPSIFEDSVIGSIRRASGGYVDLAFGVRAEFETKEVRFTDGGALIPLITRPVTVRLSYFHGNSGRRQMTRIWSSERAFLMDGTEEEPACSALISEFLREFVPALQFIVQQSNTT